MKPIILFDIDHTLLDTKKIIANTETNLVDFLKISHRSFEKTTKDYLNSLPYRNDFYSQTYTQYLANAYSSDPKLLHEMFLSGINPDVLFPDTLPTLNLLSPIYQLGIFSEGFTDFQTAKLTRTGIRDYFQPELIYIYRRKLEALQNLNLKDVVFIDDKLEIVNAIQAQGYLAIHLDRTKHNLSDIVPDLQRILRPHRPHS